MITTATLKEYTLKDLAQMAKKRGITGWHSMRKGDLIRALVRDARVASRKNGNSRCSKTSSGNRLSTRSTRAVNSAKRTVSKRSNSAEPAKVSRTSNRRIVRRIQEVQQHQEELKSLAGSNPPDTTTHHSETGVDRIVLGAAPPTGSCFVHARERSRNGDTYLYDLELTGPDGLVRERWERLQLKRVSETPPQDTWVAPLFGPYIERRLGELIPGSTASVIVQGSGESDRGNADEEGSRP